MIMQARNPGSSTSTRKIPDKPGCGPNVDTWPILDAQGKADEDEAGEEEEEEE